MELGRVALVGAGPGAADLLTVRALRLIERAQVVLYDRLVSEEVLELLPEGAERVYVGKELGGDSDGRQRFIGEELVRRALLGQFVLRLKGGDPFVFGRGGEEVLALREAGVPFEVVPGLSSVIAAPQAALIPVTHRGVSGSLGVFTGHPGQGLEDPVDWGAAARVGTAVFLMGVRKLGLIAERLLAEGRSEETPVAVIEKATRRDQRVFRGSLGDIVERAAQARSPACIVVGEVVNVLSRGLENPLRSRSKVSLTGELLPVS